MSAHTPGSWKLRKLEVREHPKQAAFKTHITLTAEGNSTVAGFVMGAGFTLQVAQEIARRCNAYEDMLDALEMVRDADNNCLVDGLPAMPMQPRLKVRAAIAKARGE